MAFTSVSCTPHACLSVEEDTGRRQRKAAQHNTTRRNNLRPTNQDKQGDDPTEGKVAFFEGDAVQERSGRERRAGRQFISVCGAIW